MSFKSIMKPEDSIVAGLATVGIVYGVYSISVGPVSDAHATAPNDGSLNSSVRKAGWESLILTAGVALLARDLNIVILGGAAIIALELAYRHAIMVNPGTGQIAPPGPADYAPASGSVVSGNFGVSASVG